MRIFSVFLFMLLGMVGSCGLAEEVAPVGDSNAFTGFWEQEIKPTVVNSFDEGGRMVFLTGAVTTIVARQYDQTVFNHNQIESDRWLEHRTADFGGWLGSGAPGIAIAVTQLFLDTPNGVRHGKAIALTSVSHITMATLVRRERPSKRNKLSFPSGHASSAFATASSLAYAYGYKAGIPAYAAASFVALSRVNENIHWLSDVVAGAALGIYWGRASALYPGKESYTILPMVSGDATLLTFNMEF
ncbi:phosphatase PAP2 family protein [Bdellovibrio bacteriovorus]|uniref:phosphatase PAP2 family protein n=1 Tax=Bdellovibrio bacteriovorus TaxID=959 RepID=UPI0035A63315